MVYEILMTLTELLLKQNERAGRIELGLGDAGGALGLTRQAPKTAQAVREIGAGPENDERGEENEK
jgi:hypothetical protein